MKSLKQVLGYGSLTLLVLLALARLAPAAFDITPDILQKRSWIFTDRQPFSGGVEVGGAQPVISAAGDAMSLPSRIALGPTIVPFPDSALGFATRTTIAGSGMVAGFEGGITADDGGTHTGKTFFGGLIRSATSSGTTFTNVSLRTLELQPQPATFTSGTHTFTNRDVLVLNGIGMAAESGAGVVTTTDYARIRGTAYPVIGDPGTVPNAREVWINLPTLGSTIRRGVHLETATSNV